MRSHARTPGWARVPFLIFPLFWCAILWLIGKFSVQSSTRGYAGPAGARLIELSYNLGRQIEQGELDDAFFRALNQVGGIVFRYPAAQIQRSVDGFTALEEGKTQNPAALIFGPTRHSGK